MHGKKNTPFDKPNPYNTMLNLEVPQKRNKRQLKHKGKRSFADFVVYISIAAVVAFTSIALIFHYIGLVEISTTLTTAWFSFWGAEIIALATIKTSKVKHGYDKEESKSVSNGNGPGDPEVHNDGNTGGDGGNG